MFQFHFQNNLQCVLVFYVVPEKRMSVKKRVGETSMECMVTSVVWVNAENKLHFIWWRDKDWRHFINRKRPFLSGTDTQRCLQQARTDVWDSSGTTETNLG